MTGNNKVWRAPLAGLASVAMLATMGVAAGTASAASTAAPKDPVKVSFVYANGSAAADVSKQLNTQSTDVPVTYGDSVIDALEGQLQQPGGTDQNSDGQYFIGYYTTDGKPFDFTAPVTADTKVVAKYADAQDVVKVTFEGGFGFYPLGAATGYLLKGSTLAAAQAPTDKADGQLTTSWSVEGTGVDTTTVKDGAVDSLDKIAVTRPKDNLPNVTVKAKTFASGVKTLIFNGKSSGYVPSSYPLNAYADGVNEGKLGDDLWVDTTADSYPAPTIITPASEQAVYSAWVNTKTNNSTKVGEDIANVKDGDIFEIDKSSKVAYATVKFDSKGGSDVAAQRVLLTEKDASGKPFGFVSKPDDPTKDGYVFKGWLNGNSDHVDWTADVSAGNSPRVYGDATLTADWQATTSELKVTFRDAVYDGSQKDVAVKVAGNEYLSESKAPSWTRTGYVFGGWQYYTTDNSHKVYSDTPTEFPVDFEFDQDLPALVNGGNDFVLYAKWVEVNEDAVKAALRYVNGEDTGAQKALFTPGSWSEFSATYKKVEAEYTKAKFDQAGSDKISAEVSAKLVSELSAAWKKLVFVNNENVLPSYRFFNKVNGEHLFTNDAREIASLKANNDWTYENKAFDTIVDTTGAFKKLASFDAAVVGAEGKKDTTVLDQLNEVADPITVGVYRLFNPANGEHLFTTDANEYNILTGRNWSGEGAVFYAPKYSSTKNVYRLFDPAKGQHLFTLDANEAQILSGKYGWSNEGVVFKAL